MFAPRHERGLPWLSGALVSRGAHVVVVDPWQDGPYGVSAGTHGAGVTIHAAGRAIDLASMTGVWARWASALRPTSPGTSAHLARHEWATFWRGASRHVPRERWVNSECAVRGADDRLVQMEAGRQVGLRVPETLVTSSHALLAEFVDRHERVVAKPLSSGRAEDSGRRTLFAVEVPRTAFARKVVDAPVLVQEFCAVDVEIRCTVVDGKVFGASVPASGDAIDIKHAIRAGAAYVPCRLFPEEERLVSDLVRALGLRFAAVDMGRPRHGSPVLFEVNGAGQYQGIEEQTGLPITDAVAAALLGQSE